MRRQPPATISGVFDLTRFEAIVGLSPQMLSAGPANRAPTCTLHLVIALIVLAEFMTVSLASYAASLSYHWLFIAAGLPSSYYIPAAFVIATLLLLVSLGLKDFSPAQMQSLHVFVWHGLRSVALSFSLFLTGLFLSKLAEPYSRATFLCQAIGVGIAVLGTRTFSVLAIRHEIRRGRLDARRVLLIGDKTQCQKLARHWRSYGIHVVACLPFPAIGVAAIAAAGDHPPRHADDIVMITSACRTLLPTEVILIETADKTPIICKLSRCFADLPVAVHLVLLDAADTLATCSIAQLGDISSIQLLRQPLSGLDQVIKRCFDIVVSLCGLLAALPILLIAALAIKLDSSGPILFRQMRHGFNNSTIQVFKLRTMRVSEHRTQFKQASRDDPRITRVGRVLRRWNIDELPQLLNVLFGEMSIVGPRPHATEHNKMFEDRIGMFARRHNVKPGITGWAQINGYRGETDTLDKMERRIECDLYYIDHWSILFDLRILLMTVFSKKAYSNAC